MDFLLWYIKDPNNPKHWVIDEEAAQVVRRIFDMTLEGFGTEQIATQFEKEGILTPQATGFRKALAVPEKPKYGPLPSGMAPRLPIFCISRSIAGIF